VVGYEVNTSEWKKATYTKIKQNNAIYIIIIIIIIIIHSNILFICVLKDDPKVNYKRKTMAKLDLNEYMKRRKPK
jgi:hypothetical protein